MNEKSANYLRKSLLGIIHQRVPLRKFRVSTCLLLVSKSLRNLLSIKKSFQEKMKCKAMKIKKKLCSLKCRYHLCQK